MTKRRLNLKNVLEEIRGLPGRRNNPTAAAAPWMCVYTDPKNPDRHCIAGQVLVNLGYRLPDVDDLNNIAGIEDLCLNMGYDINPDALEVLEIAQREADTYTQWKPESRNAWGVAKKVVEQALDEGFDA